ncbi:MAG: ribosome silencing factor [Bacteroidota bacterium]
MMKVTTTKTTPKKTAPKTGAAKSNKTAAKKTTSTASAKTSIKKNERTADQEAEANVLANKKTPVAKTRKTTKASKPAPKPASNSLELALQVAQGMYEKKGEDIKILDMRNVKGASADFFVISHAASDKQVEAIANSVEEEVEKQSNEWPRHREGQINNEWVLLDYFDVVAHVFQQEKREFYAVEELWGDAIEVPFEGR